MNGQRLLRILNELTNDTTRMGKATIMSRHKGDKNFIMTLYYAYDPFLRYHIRALPDSVRGKGTGDISINTWALFTALSKRTITGREARLKIFNYIMSLTPAAGEVVRRILKKNLKCGVNIKSINGVFPNLLPNNSVMKAYDYAPVKLAENNFISPKIDGIRAPYYKGNLYFRNGKIVEGMDHILKHLNPMERYDGELFIPGMGFDEASGIIRSGATQKLRVVYGIFDCITDPDLPLSLRLDKLVGFSYSGVCRRIPHVLIVAADPRPVIAAYYKNARLNGYEGIMVKDASAPYVRKRSDYWLKLKPVSDAEFKILDVFEGEGKYAGMLGGIVIQLGRITGKVGGGFSDYQRESWWRWPKKIIGKMATIKYMEKTKTGRLRHPEFKSIRWDT